MLLPDGGGTIPITDTARSAGTRSAMLLRTRYEMSGTEIGHAPSRRQRGLLFRIRDANAARMLPLMWQRTFATLRNQMQIPTVAVPSVPEVRSLLLDSAPNAGESYTAKSNAKTHGLRTFRTSLRGAEFCDLDSEKSLLVPTLTFAAPDATAFALQYGGHVIRTKTPLR
eukprot:786023-Rhodomonas_salina.3